MVEGKGCKTIELGSGKELPNAHKNRESERIEERGIPGIEEENKGGWEEVHKLLPPLEPMKYVPKLPYSQRQQRKQGEPKIPKLFEHFQKVDN